MAKIGRIDKGDRPSGVPGGRFPVSPQDAAAPFQMAANVADVGMQVAAQEEYAEAKRRRDAEEAIKAYENEAESGLLAGQFEDNLAARVEAIKAEKWDRPQDAPAAIRQAAQEEAAKSLEGATNPAARLQLQRDINSRSDSAVRGGQSWSLDRRIQKVKASLEGQVNRFSRGAANLPNDVALDSYLMDADKMFAPLLSGVFGDEAEGRLRKAKNMAVREWIDNRSLKDPIGLLKTLDKAVGPTNEFLNGDERDAGKEKAKHGWEGMGKTQEYEALKTGLARFGGLYDLFVDGTLDASTILAEQTAIEEQAAFIKAQSKVDVAELKRLGVDPGDSAEKQLETLDDRAKFLNGLARARRRSLAFSTPEDDPTTLAGLIVGQDKAIKASTKSGADLALLVKQQRDIAIAYGDGKIKEGTFNTFFRDMAKAVNGAVSKEANVNYLFPDTWDMWGGDARDSGVIKLNVMISDPQKSFNKLSEPEKQKAYMKYLDLFSRATKAGKTVDDDKARRMALQALQFVSGEHLEGADQE